MVHVTTMPPARSPKQETESAYGDEQQEQANQWSEAAESKKREWMPKAITIVWIRRLPIAGRWQLYVSCYARIEGKEGNSGNRCNQDQC